MISWFQNLAFKWVNLYHYAEVKHLLYLFTQGQTAVLVWKSQ